MRQPNHDRQSVDRRRHGRCREVGRLTLATVVAVGVLCSFASASLASNALSLDGVDSYVIVNGDPAALKLTGALTVEAWIRHPAGAVAEPAVIASKAGPAGPSWVLDLTGPDVPPFQGEGVVEFGAFGGNATQPAFAYSTQALNDGLWHHVAGVWDGTDARIYIDGVLDGVSPETTSLPLADTTEALVIGADAGLAAAVLFTGDIDEVRMWDIARTQPEVSAAMNSTLTGTETNLVGYWNFDDATVNDVTPNGSHGTIGGGAVIAASDAPVTGAAGSGVLALDGIDDHVAIPNSALYDFTSGTPFAVSLWVKPDATQLDVGSTDNAVVEKWSGGAAYPFVVRYRNQTDGTAPGHIEAARTDGTSTVSAVSTTPVDDGAWHHVAIVSDGSTFSLYVDGALEGSASEAGLGATANGSNLWIGRQGSGLYPLTGSIDEVRIWDGWLTAAEVAADMIAPTPALPGNGGASVGRWSFDGDASDGSGNANDGTLVNGAAAVATPVANVSVSALDFGSQETGTTSAVRSFTITNDSTETLTVASVSIADARYAVTGAASSLAAGASSSFDVTFTPDTAGTIDAVITIAHDGRGLGSVSLTGVGQPAAGANSVLLDGVDDYVIIAGDPVALKLTGSMTVEAWFKHPAGAVAAPAVIASKAGAGGPSWVMDLLGDGTLEFGAFGNNAATPSFATTTQALNDGVWHHAAGVWDGVDARLYIDGALDGVGATSSAPLLDTTDEVVFGTDATLDPTALFTGEIDEVRMWDIARSSAEIIATMNTTLVGTETNLVGYWNFDDGTANDLTAGASHGTFGGGAGVVASGAPLSSATASAQALTLDGIDDFVEVGNTASLQITGAVTVESWFRTSRDFSADTPSNTLAGKWYAGGTRAAYGLVISDTAHFADVDGLTFVIYNDSLTHLAASSFLDYNDGQWRHAAGTWDGSTIRLYVDGVLVASNTDAAFGAISNITDPFRIGTDAFADASRWFQGDLDDVRVWSVARSQADVQAGIIGGVDPSSVGLVGQWTFDSGGGSDGTANANDGVLMGGASTVATPVVDVSVTALDFGSQDTGVQSAGQTFTVTNSGDSAANINAVGTGDPTRYAVSGPALPLSLAAGEASQAFAVTFTPDAVGTFDSNVLLTHDARGLTSIALSGTGQAAAGTNVVSFDGFSGMIDTGVTLPTELQSAFTAAAWVRLSSLPGAVATVVGSNEGSLHLSVDSLGYARAAFWTAGVEELAVSASPLVTGRWHHVAGTYDGVTVTVYVDGVAAGTYTPVAGTAVNGNSTPLQIGGLDDTTYGGFFTGNFLAGDVDEARVWNIALTEADIQAEMNTDVAGNIANLLGHWNFDGGTATDEVSATVGTLLGGASIFATGIATVSLTSLEFGSVDQNATSASQSVTLTNSGSLDVTVNGFSTTDPTRFTATSGDTFPLTISAGLSSGPISVTFSPDVLGALTATLDIDHDARGVSSVALAGTGQTTIVVPTGDLNNTKIVFAQAVNGSTQDIFVRDADGTLTNLTNNPTVHETAPSWSPDGTQIAFSSKASGNQDIWIMDFDTATNTVSNPVQLTFHTANDWTPRWSPLGDEIAFHSSRFGSEDLFKVTADGLTETQLTFDAAGDNRVTWSPDGTQIAYSSTRGVSGEEDIFIIPASGGDAAPIQLTATADEEIYPAWSPDGTQIAFEARPVGGQWDLYVIGVDGTGLAALTTANDATFHENRPAWSPDGTRIAYDSDVDGDSELYAVNADNTGVVDQLTTNAVVDTLPSWSPFLATAAVVGEQALVLDGIDGYASVPDSAAIDFAGGEAFTVATWVKAPTPISSSPIVSKRDSAGSMVGYEIRVEPTGTLSVDLVTGTAPTFLAGTAFVGDDVWHHVALTFDGAAASLYVDGALDTSLTDASYSGGFSNASELRLGTTTTVAGGVTLAGMLDSARVWNVALTAAELRSEMNLGAPQAGALVAAYEFNDGAVTDDIVANNGALVGGATTALIAVAQFDVLALTFGAVDVPTSGSLTFTVTNAGDADLNLTSVVAPGNTRFAVPTPGTPWSLAPTVATTAIAVTFTPDRASGEFTTLDLVHDGRGISSIDLSGVGRLTGLATGDLATSSKIAFSRDVGGVNDIFSYDFATETDLTNNVSADETDASWSPDGTQYAFVSSAPGNREVFIGNADGSAATQVTFTAEDEFGTDWSPDGTRIAFYRIGAVRDIYTITTDGVTEVAVTQNAYDDLYPTWSPDGQKLAFYSNRDGDNEIFVIDADGTNERQLTDNAESDTFPSWSPDGSVIAFDRSVGGSQSDIFTMSADGTNEFNVTNTASESEQWASWSPDGLRVAYQSAVDGDLDIYARDVDGLGVVDAITVNAGTDSNADWSAFLPVAAGARALTLDGIDDYVNVGDVVALQPTTAFTVEAWFRTSGPVGDFHTLVSKWATGGVDGAYSLAWTTVDGLVFMVNKDTGAAIEYVAAASGLTYDDGLWHHAAGTFDGSYARLYVDGDLVGTASNFSAGSVHATTQPFRIGGDGSIDSGSVDRYFPGDIDDVRVWNVARAASEIAASVNGVIDPATTGVVGYWDFDDGAATDLSANANDGTLVGGAGTFVIPVATFDVTSLPLGVTDIGTQTAAQSFTIINTGDVDLNLTSAAVADVTRFTVDATGLPALVPVGATSSPIAVTFTADRAGGELSRVDIVHDGRGASHVNVSGVGRLTTVPTGVLADTRIAFALPGATNKNIWAVDPDGLSPAQLTDDTTNDWNPAWSPDASQIAFQTDRDANREIYVMNADGTSPVNLSNTAGNDQTPSWSPDGTQIAFTSNRDGDNEIFVMNADGTTQTQLTFDANSNRRPMWSPDGQKIAFFSVDTTTSVTAIFAMDPDGANVTLLTDDTKYAEYPRWSPDGAQIAYAGEDVTAGGGGGEATAAVSGFFDIWVMDADGSNHVNLTSTTSSDYEPFWSPDGTQIVFSGQSGGTGLFIVDAAGGEVTAVAGTAGGANPAWSTFTTQALAVEERVALLDGVDDDIVMPDDTAYNFDTAADFTVSMWVKPDSVQLDTSGAENVIVEKADATGAYPFAIRYLNGTTADSGRLLVARDDGSAQSNVISVTTIDDGRYHHVAFVRDAGELRLYIDGALDEAAPDDTVNPTTNVASLYVGTRADGAHRFAGAVDDIRIYSGALTATEVREDAASVAPIVTTGGAVAVANWTFDDGTATDLVGAATGTATGTTFPATPLASIDVTDLAFGVTDVGLSATSLSFSVTNDGAEALVVTDVVTGDAQFAVTAVGLPVTLSTGQSTSPITVDFTPSYVGDERAWLSVVHDGKRGTTALAQGIGRIDPPTGDLADTRIAFASDRRLADGTREVYTMAPDGSSVLPTRTGVDWNAAWSPDGARLAFQTDIGSDREIFAMNADGSDPRNLTNSVGQDQTPDWSPDGTQIAFVSDRDGNQEIYVMQADGSGQTRLTETPESDRRPRWSPDGSKLVFVTWPAAGGDAEVFVMRADGTDRLQVTDDPAADNYPVWSPDGASIAFLTVRDGNSEIYTAGAGGAFPTRLTNTPEDETDGLDWSPDGTRLVVAASDAVGDAGGDKEIITLAADGTDRRALTVNSTLDAHSRWSGYLPEMSAWLTLTDGTETRGAAIGLDSLATDAALFSFTEDVAAGPLVVTEPVELTGRRDGARLLRDIAAIPVAGASTTWSLTARVPGGTGSTATLGWRQEEIDALLLGAGDYDNALLTDTSSKQVWALSPTNNPIALNTSANGVYKFDLTIEKTATQSVTYNLDAGWNLVSVPGGGDLSALQGANASAFTWDAANGKYATLGQISETFVSPVATGFWLLTTAAGPYTVDLDVDSQAARSVSATLKPGWNLIGAPADLPTPLLATAVDGGYPQNVLGYTAGTYSVASELSQGMGYWVLNSSGADRDVSLTQMRHLSEDGQDSLFRAAPKLPDLDWEFRLSLDMTGGATHAVSLGSGKSARAGYDTLDIPQPPSPAARGFTAFYAEAEGVASRLTRSVVPVAKEDVEWTLAARMAAAGTLRWDGIELPEGYRLFLRRGGETRALDGQGALRLPKGEHSLSALLTWTPPSVTRTLPNYPNPFNPETWIPFELSEAAEVSIRIYDSRGMLVRSVDVGYRDEGYYTRRAESAYWDGRNEFGERVASGVYVYEVRAGSYRGLRRMVVLK